MLPKRAAKLSSCGKKAAKVRKLNGGRVKVSEVVENRSLSPLEIELKRALDQSDSENSYVLHLAQEVIKMPNVPSELAMRILKFCIKVGNEYVVHQLLSNQTINLKTPEGGELLWAAVDNAQVEIATMLVCSGVDLNVRKAESNSTFLYEVLKSWEFKDNVKKEELIRLMVSHGADVNACNSHGYSVLHEALCHDRCSSELVEVLLQHGANVQINKNIDLDDIFWASCYKPELIPKLIEHQVPDEQTRNQRGFIAISTLLSKDCTGAKMASAVKMVKEILDMGIPVNTVDPFPERRRYARPCPLLSTALFSKKKDAVKLLLEYGADPHQLDDFGRTPLYLATGIANYTHATRWLIERGANIHTPNDDDSGCFPIHGAYQHQSVKNIHLLFSLGADINITDKKGLTPFQYTKDMYYIKDYHRLFIKLFALIISKGGKISNDDEELAKRYVWGSHHFKKCLKQLKRMKTEYICDEVPYFSLFSENMYSMLQLMKNPYFARKFKKNEQKRETLFPQYTHMLLHNFEIAEIRYNMLQRQKKQINEAADKIFPDLIIEKIALYSCIEKLERCQYEYFMDFHADLKNTNFDKDKIL